MSKPVTNEEVEDVLSSIRRLVSEDKRPLAGLRSAAAEPAPTPEAEREPSPEVVDRFVLTPALRVTDQQDVAAEVDAAPLDLGSVARNTWTENEANDSENAPMVLFPSSEVSSAQEHEHNSDTEMAALVHEAVETQELEDEDSLDEGDYSDESYWDTSDDEASEVQAEPETPVQGKEQFDDGDYDDADWDVDEDERYSSDTVEEDAADLDFETPEEIYEDDVSKAAPEAEEAPANASALTDKIAALEAAVGEIAQEWEPDGEIEEELTSSVTSAMAWEDNVDLDATGEPIQAAFDDAPLEAEEIPEEPSAAVHADSDAGGEEPLMDEAALRDLVSEIVRAELQGALGERITRNVRKLVRREIHRALTAQDME